MKKEVTLISKERLIKGEMYTLVKEPSNTHDADAIKVVKDGVDVGYVANSSHTVFEGSLSASMLKEEFSDELTVKIEYSGFMDRGYFRTPATVEVAKKSNKEELRFSLVGGTTSFPGKRSLVADIKKGTVLVKLQLDNETSGEKSDRIIGVHNGLQAGSVKADEETFTALYEFVEDVPELLVEAYDLDKGAVLCKVKVSAGARKVSSPRVSLEDEIKRILDSGIDTEENLNEKVKYLRENKITEVAIANLFKSYSKYPEEVQSRIPKKPTSVYIDTAGIVSDSIAFANVGDNLMFSGDKGVGKNVLTVTLAWLYNRPLYEFSSNSQHSNNSLLGGKTFEDTSMTEEESKKSVGEFKELLKVVRNVFFGKKTEEAAEPSVDDARAALLKFFGQKDQKLVFEMSSIVEAMLQGGIIVLDEINTSVSNVLSIFNSALDDRRRIEITGYGCVEAHPNFMAIGTMNLNYEGTFEMNEAMKDRFVTIPFPALSTISPILQSKVPTLGYDTIVQMNKVYLGVKNAVSSGTLSEDALTIRGFISAAKVISQGMSMKNALIKGVANRVDDIDSRQAIIDIIDLQIS